MKGALASLASGVLFAVGLGVSGMTRPSKVAGFLDLFGAWDPSLAFVMVGAIAVYAVAFRVITRSKAPWFDGKFHIPRRADIDRPLLLGAAIFGVGWGLGGYCPGPGLVSAASGALPAALFCVGMVLGVRGEGWVRGRASRARAAPGERESELG